MVIDILNWENKKIIENYIISSNKMLNSSSSSFKSSKINQYMMRRRARNLRAKVKALLPVQICSKHDHRNRSVEDIQNNKKSWQRLKRKKCWNNSQDKQNNCYYFCQDSGQVDNNQRFSKLMASQIQQIKEDKLYYLGQANINDFESFVKRKKKHKFSQAQIDIISKLFSNIFDFKSQKPQACKKASEEAERNVQLTLDIQDQRGFHQRKFNVDQKLRQFTQRKKIIDIQFNSKRITDKVKLNMKLERADNNLRELSQKKNQLNMAKSFAKNETLQKISKRRRNLQNQSQIKDLQEKLRKTFLARKSKTSKQIRTARTELLQEDAQCIF